MDIFVLFKAAIVFYLLGAVAYLLFAIFGHRRLQIPAILFTWFGLGTHTAVLIDQISATGRPPLANMYETHLFLAWLMVVFTLAMEKKHRLPILGALTLPVVIFLMGLASVNVKEAMPLMPSLRSNWLLIHVFTCSISYTAFAVSFACSGFYLVFAQLEKAAPFAGKKDKLLEKLDSVSLHMIDFGFPFLTIGIVTGSVWADLCWGTYWSWDPKETWSLVTWLVYAICLHMRHVHSWRGRWAAAACVLGFTCVICTYLGVNYLFSTLHAYA